MMALHSTPATAGSAQGTPHPPRAAGSTPLDSLPFLSRLARTASNASSAAGSPAVPAAAAARGTATLPPAASGSQSAQQQHMLLSTPASFNSRRRSPGLAASPGFGPAGSAGSLRLRSTTTAAAGLLSAGSRRLSAPTGYSESGMSDAAGPSFSLQAPSGLSSDEEDENEVDSSAVAGSRGPAGRRRRLSAGVAGVRPLGPAELALVEATARLDLSLKEQAQRKVAALERSLADIDAAEAAALAAAAAQRAQQAAATAAAEAAAAAARQQQRSALLSGLRSAAQQKAAEGQRRVQELEALQAQQREAAAAAAKAKQERQVAAEAATKAEEQRREQAELAKAAEAAAAEQAAAQRKQAAAAAAAVQASGLRIAASAARWEKECAAALAAAQALAKPFVEDRVLRDKKRAIDKFVTLNVQQISATLEQVRLKANALAGFMAAQHGAQRAYALLTLANKLVSQCEVQVTRLNSFAFPLAEVAVAVASAQPEFAPLLVARLHQACPLTVPKYTVFKKAAGAAEGEAGSQADDAYLKQLGYRISVDEDTGRVERESTDEFVGRMAGYLMLYAAVLQSDNPQNPHGLQHAWTYLARLLNALPANRVTATAVDAVLKVAGYRMHAAYRGQFSKLLQYIDREFLPALGTSNDPDARAVYTRIQTYLRTAQFTRPPEGRDMPQFDASSYDRA